MSFCIPETRRQVSWHRRPACQTFSWGIFLSFITGMLLASLTLVYLLRFHTLPFAWHLPQEKWEVSNSVDLFIDAEHVIYVGKAKRIALLDTVLTMLQQEQQQNTKTAQKELVIQLHLDKGVSNSLLLRVLSRLEGSNARIYIVEEAIDSSIKGALSP